MANINSSIKTGSGFLLKNAPLDVKLTAVDIAERNSYVKLGQNVLYKGAVVYVEADDRFYVYTGVEPTGEDYSACFRSLLSGTASEDMVAKLASDNEFSGKNNFTQAPTVNGVAVVTNPEVEATITGKVGSELQAHSTELDKLAAFSEEGLMARTTDGFKAVAVEGTDVTVATDLSSGKVTLGLASVGTAGSYTKVTTDAQGRVTAGENPTTVDGYGITDAVKISGSTMTGELVLDYDVSAASGKAAVTKEWAESVALGYVHHEDVETAAVDNLEGTYTAGADAEFPGVGATFAITATEIGGHTLAVGDRVLLAGQTDQTQNGVYVYSAEGVLTRAEDLDGKPKISYHGASFLVSSGALKGTVYTIQEAEEIIFGTDAIVFVKTFTPSEYSAGAGVVITNNEIAVAQGTTVQVVDGKLEVASGAGNEGKVLVAGADGTAASYKDLNLSNVEGVLGVAKGGTGATTLPAGQLLVGNGEEAVGSVANGEGLLIGSADGAPAFGKADLTKHVDGVLPVANGGFGTSSHTEGALVVGGADNSLAEVAPAEGVLISTGTGAPAFGKVNVESHIEGTLAIANGGTGATDKATAFANLAPVAATKGDIMYFDGTQWVALAKGPVNSILAVTENGLEYITEIDAGTF